MIRSRWSRLAKTAYRSLLERLAQRAPLARSRRLRRGYDCCGTFNVAAEMLEVRQLLFAPIANADSASDTHDHTLSVGAGSGVLANDMNMGMGTMTAVLCSSPSHGTLSAFIHRTAPNEVFSHLSSLDEAQLRVISPP